MSLVNRVGLLFFLIGLRFFQSPDGFVGVISTAIAVLGIFMFLYND